MNKRSLILLAFILPYIVMMAACNQKDKTEAPYENQRTITKDYEAPKENGVIDDQTGSNQTAPSTTMKDLVKTDGTKQVNYQQQDETYNTQDKRMIVRSGTMSMEVDKYDDTEARVKQIVNSANGYITNSTSTLNTSGKKQGTITIRVASN